MNVFFVFDDGSLLTPPLGTILPGRTVQPLPVKELTHPPRIVRPPQPPAGLTQPARQGVRGERRRQQAVQPAQPATPAVSSR